MSSCDKKHCHDDEETCDTTKYTLESGSAARLSSSSKQQEAQNIVVPLSSYPSSSPRNSTSSSRSTPSCIDNDGGVSGGDSDCHDATSHDHRSKRCWPEEHCRMINHHSNYMMSSIFYCYSILNCLFIEYQKWTYSYMNPILQKGSRSSANKASKSSASNASALNDGGYSMNDEEETRPTAAGEGATAAAPATKVESNINSNNILQLSDLYQVPTTMKSDYLVTKFEYVFLAVVLESILFAYIVLYGVPNLRASLLLPPLPTFLYVQRILSTYDGTS